MNQKNVLLAIIIAFILVSCRSGDDSSSPSSSPFWSPSTSTLSSPYYYQEIGHVSPPDKHSQILQGRIGAIENLMGRYYEEYQYYIPNDKKLIVTMKAKLNGEILPEMSGHFHLPPPKDPEKKNEGRISIVFYNPPFQLKEPIGATWNYQFSPAGHKSFGYSGIFPFEWPKASARISGQTSVKGLKADQEYGAWDFELSDNGREKNKQLPFHMEMYLRIAPIDEDTDRNKVIRTDLQN